MVARRLFPVAVCLFSATMLTLLAFPAAADAQPAGVIYACVNNNGNNASVRLVGAADACRPNEFKVSWNVMGPQGSAGPQGPTGATGATGPTGATGLQGPQGLQGENGATGPQGPQGETGAQGPQGLQGNTGAQGPQGPTGPQGPQGPAGQNGQDGQDGQDGQAGQNAPAGSISGELTSCTPDANFAGYLVHIPGRAFSVFTGANGSFQIDNVPTGTYTLSIENDGMVLATMTDVEVGSGPVALDDLLLSNTQTDNNNCGACGNACVSGNVCVNGGCEAAPLCAPGSVAPCYDGPAGTEGIGACATGVMSCNASGTGYGACAGAVLPSAEVCGDLIDNDCDGALDEGCQSPTQELCNGVDDDLDGSVDNGFPVGAACSNGQPGTCAQTGVLVCSPDGHSTVCNAPPGIPSVDLCGDNLDNDCDGAIDEACVCAPGSSASCYTGPAGTASVGLCQPGTQTCNTGGTAFGACVGQVLPAAEFCDNLDNDCDGMRDEGVTQSCYTGPAGTNGVGTCHGGTQTCAFGAFGACVGQIVPSAEVCGDSLDNDCDGAIDETCS